MKFAVVVFPGSNCDHDAYHAAKHVLGQEAEFVWHKDTSLAGADVVVLPGGFAHGDYLRTGAIARFSPVMQEVKRFAAAGGPVIGICNGFQVLLEAGLLPGAMLRNTSLQFRCEHVYVRVAAGGERAAEPEGTEARAKAGAATAAAGPAVRLAGPGLRKVRVNDPARDKHQQDQTTQSETTIAVAGRNVAVGYNDSQQSLLFTTQGSSLSGYSYSRDGGRTFSTSPSSLERCSSSASRSSPA